MSEDVDAVMPILNGSRSEQSKYQDVELACEHFGVELLGKPREQLIEQNKATGFDGVIDWLNETRSSQGRNF